MGRAMLLRWLVGDVLRQAAQKNLLNVMSQAARAAQGAAQGGERRGPARAESDASLRQRILPGGVVFVFAMNVESGGLVDLLRDAVTTRCPAFLEHAGYLNDQRLVIAESGVGGKAAARATEDVIAIHKPSWVVSTGFAGALREELRRGHILMADSVADEQGKHLSVGLKVDPQAVQASPSLHLGRLLTVDRLVHAADERRRLADEHGASACDMESMAVAETCRRKKVRFLSVRIISEAVDAQMPVELDCLVGQKSVAAKLGVAAGALVKRPSTVKDLWKLREEATKASDRLAKFLAGVLTQLEADSASA